MADGELVGKSDVLNALLDLGGRVSSAESLLGERVSHKDLMTTFNDLRRELVGKVETSAADQNKTLHSEMEKLKLLLAQSNAATIDQAVTRALEARRTSEKAAREEIDNKAKDAVRGVQLLAQSQGWAVLVLLVLVLILGANAIWKFI